MLKKYSLLLVGLILLAFYALSLSISSQETTTMDERAHIPSAYSYVKYNDMRLNPEHPPLIKDLAGYPLLFFNLKFPIDDPAWTTGANEQWDLGVKFIHSNDAEKVTYWSRFPIILVALLLGFFVFLWSKEISGTVAGIFALILYVCDPNIIGHSHYVTTDIGIAAFIFFSFYFFLKFLRHPNWKNTILAGIFLGLVQLTKFSAVIIFPYFGLILLTYAFFRKQRPNGKAPHRSERIKIILKYFGKYIIAIVICFVLIWLVYFYNTFNMPGEKIPEVANSYHFSEKPLSKAAKVAIAWSSEIPLLKPLSEYLLGVSMVFIRVSGGNTYYFFGDVSNHATPWYFPAVFFAKETIPLLALMIFSIIYSLIELRRNLLARKQKSFWKKMSSTVQEYLRTGVVYYSMFGFIIFYSLLSIFGNLNIGFRHLFPILPFIYVLVAKKVFDFLKSIKNKHNLRIVKAVFIFVTCWIIIEPIIFYPSYISYFNEIFGGPKNGYKYVTDSNLDWGQDMKRLQQWVDENNIDKIRVDYFGGADPAYYLGDKFAEWHSYWEPEPGWYAISAGFMQESIYKKNSEHDKNYQWTLQHNPIRIGDSIFVFEVK